MKTPDVDNKQNHWRRKTLFLMFFWKYY